jgi:hypothetical protein
VAEVSDRTSSGLKFASTLVELLKNVVVLAVVIYVAFYSRSAIRKVMGNVQSGAQSVTDVEIGDKTLKLKLTEAREHLVVALNDAAKSGGKADQPVSREAQNISAALNATTEALQSVTPPAASQSELWVYLGSQVGSGWKSRNFNLTVAPLPGVTLRANTDVYKRNARPKQTPTPTDPDNLDFGDAVGVLRLGETVTLIDVMSIHPVTGEVDWWGRIR